MMSATAPHKVKAPAEGMIRVQAAKYGEEVFKPLPKPEVVQWIEGTVASHQHGAGRYDAPDFSFEVSYATSSRSEALIEILAPLRSDPRLVEQLAQIPAQSPWHQYQRDTIPLSVLDGKAYLSIHTDDEYADVMHSKSLAWLSGNPTIWTAVWAGGFSRGKGGLTIALITGDGRGAYLVCQTISKVVHTQLGECDGIRYFSKSGADAECWAVFHRSTPQVRFEEMVDVDSSEVLAVLKTLGLTLQIPE